jgi:hypothetical protein
LPCHPRDRTLATATGERRPRGRLGSGCREPVRAPGKSGELDRAVIAAAATLHLHALVHWLNALPASAVVWEAKTRLNAGDLAGASAALGKLTGPEGKVAEPWIKAVQSRIAANQVLELLETVAQSRIAGLAQRS